MLQETRQKIMILIFIGAVAATILVVALNYKEKVVSTLIPEAQPLAKESEEIKKITLDFGIFESEKFKSLKSYGALPIVVGEQGRTNPFTPL